jgi:hypothetical protein
MLDEPFQGNPFLVLMIPIPMIVFNQITFPLQLLASRFSAEVLSWLGVPVLREGNVHCPALHGAGSRRGVQWYSLAYARRLWQ